jgi:hypothetical protein
MYRAFYHKSNISQQMHKIIDVYEMYLSPYICFSKLVPIFKGFLAGN